MKGMKKIRVLKKVMTRTRSDRIIAGYLLFFALDAAALLLLEPSITSYGDALWYCYVAASTIGFGDIVVETFAGRVLSVVLSVYTVFAAAILTGVIVNFHSQLMKLQQKDSIEAFADRLERLPELDRDELCEISRKISEFRGSGQASAEREDAGGPG